MRAEMLASVLGIAPPTSLLASPDGHPLSMVAVVNDRPAGPAQASIPLNWYVRSDFFSGAKAALHALHAQGALLPLMTPPTALPAATPTFTPPADWLQYLGRKIQVFPPAALVDPGSDPVALASARIGRPIPTRMQRGRHGAPAAAPWYALQLNAGGGGTVEVALPAASFVPLVPVLALNSGFYPGNPLPLPANTSDVAWASLKNVTGLIPGVTSLGSELVQLYSPNDIGSSAVVPYLTMCGMERASRPCESLPVLAMQKLILRNFQSPGDIVMLTAAVRDLHAAHPRQYLTDVRTPCPDLWENNPYLTPLQDDAPDVTVIDCHYPLIHRSNHAPYHFLHGFIEYLNEQLGSSIRPTAFRGDIHLSSEEKGWMSQVQRITDLPIPFWIVVAGGKRDFTIKWWDPPALPGGHRSFCGRIAFVQVGEAGHEHCKLENTIDLVGKTNLRQLIRLTYHAQGVLCPVTSLMHLAAAVEVPAGMPKNRPCVVVAGGREPPHWEAYPHHQFLHRAGALSCCDNGGCWKSRVRPLGDGDPNDLQENLCVDVVTELPRCMELITAQGRHSRD